MTLGVVISYLTKKEYALKLLTKEFLVEEIVNKHREYRELAREYDIDKNLVGIKMREYGLCYKEKNYEWLKSKIENNYTISEMAEESNCKDCAIKSNLERTGLIELYRTIGRKNRIKIYRNKGFAILYPTTLERKEIGYAIIDIDDIEKVEKHTWRYREDGYSVCKTKQGVIYIQNLIMGNLKVTVDHVNRNPKDNRKENLRVATQSQNRMNKGLQSNNTSGVSGVNFRKDTCRWKVRVKVNDKEIHLGYYKDIEEAIQVRLDNEMKYYGEFSGNYNKKTERCESEFKGKLYYSRNNIPT